MKSGRLTFLTRVTLFGLLTIPVGLAGQNANSEMITFEAPGAVAGSGQGTGCFGCTFGINQWGAGTYLDANNVFHGLVRSPKGKFTTFDATGAGTGSHQGRSCFSDCPVGLND
jgi:hypothetical protein